jgi:hypothetical protein
MTLEERLFNNFKEAMKNKETSRVSTLSFLRAQLGYTALEKKKKNLDDNECLAVIRRLIKQHEDSIEQFKAGKRQDLVDKEMKELEILKAYLPEELSSDELKKIIEGVIQEISAAGIKDMGRVMKEVLARTKGAGNGKLVSELVKEKLLYYDADKTTGVGLMRQ